MNFKMFGSHKCLYDMCFISKSFMGAKDIAFHHSKAKFENIEHVQTKVIFKLPSN